MWCFSSHHFLSRWSSLTVWCVFFFKNLVCVYVWERVGWGWFWGLGILGIRMLWSTCGGQRSDFTLLEACLLIADAHTRLKGLWAFEDSPVSGFHLITGMLGSQPWCLALYRFRGSELRSSCLCGKSFTHWAISPARAPFYFMFPSLYLYSLSFRRMLFTNTEYGWNHSI